MSKETKIKQKKPTIYIGKTPSLKTKELIVNNQCNKCVNRQFTPALNLSDYQYPFGYVMVLSSNK